MKQLTGIIKLGLISAIIFFLLITAISLFIPSRVRISRATNIHASPDAILGRIGDFNTWSEWNPFLQRSDSASVEIFEEGNAMKYGKTIIRWKSKKQDEYIAEMVSGNSRPVNSVWRTINYETSDSTTLQWYMDFNLRWYPWEKFSSLMLEKSYGPSMEKGLERLSGLP